MTGSLTGKVAIVTGASSGVGAATARLMAREGAALVLAARSVDALARIARETGALAIPTDVTKRADLETLVAGAIAEHGRLDILVNNAGANIRGPLLDLDATSIETIIDTNLRAPLVLTRLALPHLIANKGVVVNVASIAGHVPLPGEVAYCASKWGLRGFSLALAGELRAVGVASCLVSPGPIRTPFLLHDLDGAPDLIFSQPFLTAEQVADAVLACTTDRRAERAIPASTLFLARLVRLAPRLQALLQPALEAKGRRVRAAFRASGEGR